MRGGCNASEHAGVKSEVGSQSRGRGSIVADVARGSRELVAVVRSVVDATSALMSDNRLKYDGALRDPKTWPTGMIRKSRKI